MLYLGPFPDKAAMEGRNSQRLSAGLALASLAKGGGGGWAAMARAELGVFPGELWEVGRKDLCQQSLTLQQNGVRERLDARLVGMDGRAGCVWCTLAPTFGEQSCFGRFCAGTLYHESEGIWPL